MKGIQLTAVVNPLLGTQQGDHHLLAIELLKQVRAECWTDWDQLGTAAEQILIRVLVDLHSKESMKEAFQRHKALKDEAQTGNRFAQNAVKRLSKLF